MEESTYSQQQREEIRNMFEYWSQSLKLPTIGPFQAFSKDFLFYMHEISNLSQTLVQLQANLKEYWIQMNNKYLEAMNEANKRISEDQNGSKKGFENYRRVMIDVFEDTFTGFFNSEEFGSLNAKVTNSQLDAVKHLQNIIEANCKTLNLPTRSEIDQLSKEVHDLERIIHEIKKI